MSGPVASLDLVITVADQGASEMRRGAGGVALTAIHRTSKPRPARTEDRLRRREREAMRLVFVAYLLIIFGGIGAALVIASLGA